MSELDERLKAVDGPEDDLDAKQWRASVASKLFGKAAPDVRIGRHRVVERIGEGASGVVYLAVDPELDRRVAVKVLRPEALSFSEDPEAWLAREAKTLAKLSHPNVVPVYDVGKHEGKVHITLEFVEGSNLRQWLKQTHSIAEIVDVLGQAGRGLAAAHGAGVVHRDFKPENVLLGDDGRVRVSDFGIARRLDATQQEPTLPEGVEAMPPHAAGETTTHRTAGTPAYMAPEQFLGDPVDARTDQFAFCVVLHEALYGRRPFLGGDRAKLAANVIAGRRIIPPGGDPPPRWLERVVARGLNITPDDRYASMEALLAELGRDRRRRLWPLAAVGVVGVGSVVALSLAPADPDRCDGGSQKVGEVWNDDVSDGVRVAFNKTDLPYAEDSWARVDEEVRRYSDAWALAHRNACESGADDSVVVERLHCLQSRVLELESLANLYAQADATVVEHSVRAVRTLRKPQECLVVQAASAEEPDADRGHIRVALAEAKAQGDLGRPRIGAARAWEAARDAQALRDRALEAEALIVAGGFEQLLLAEQHAPSPDTTTYAAVLAAEAARRPDLHARALVAHFMALVGVGQFERAFEWEAQCRAAVEAMGSPPELVGQLEYHVSLGYDSLGRADEGRAAADRALAAVDNDDPGGRPWLVSALNIRGEWAFYEGNFTAALADYQRTLALAVQELGPRHVWAANGHGNMAEVFFVTGDYDRALTHFETALSIRREAFGNETLWVPHTLAHVGDVRRMRGETLLATQAYAEALRLRTETDMDADQGRPRPAVYADLQGDLQVPWIRRGLAFAALDRGELDEALEHAKSVERSVLPTDLQHTDLTGRLDAVGQVLLAMGRYQEAAIQLEGALAQMEEHYGPKHRFLAFPLTALGRARYELGDDLAAMQKLLRALGIRSTAPRAHLRSRADAELTLAKVFARIGPPQSHRARPMAKSAMEHYEGAANTRPQDLAAARDFLASLP